MLKIITLHVCARTFMLFLMKLLFLCVSSHFRSNFFFSCQLDFTDDVSYMGDEMSDFLKGVVCFTMMSRGFWNIFVSSSPTIILHVTNSRDTNFVPH